MDVLSFITDHFSYLGVFVLLVLGGFGLPIPEDTTLILCGFLAARGTIRLVPAIAVVYPGLLIADTLLYFFGKRFGRRIVELRRFHRVLPPERLAALENRFRTSGSLFILFGRQVVGLRVQMLLVAGIMRMPYRMFLAADALSAIGTITIMTGIGYVGGNSFEALRRNVLRVEHIVAVAMLAVVLVVLLVWYFRGGRKRY